MGIGKMKIGESEIKEVPKVLEFRDEELDWAVQEGEMVEVANSKGGVKEFQIQKISPYDWLILGPQQEGGVFVPASAILKHEINALFQKQFQDSSGHRVSLKDKVTVMNQRGEKLNPLTVYRILGKDVVVLVAQGAKPKIHLLDWIALLWNIVKGS